jgi:hypothetical protein
MRLAQAAQRSMRLMLPRPQSTVFGVEKVEGVDTCPYCYPYTLFLPFLPLFSPSLWNSLRRSIYTLYQTPYFPLE